MARKAAKAEVLAAEPERKPQAWEFPQAIADEICDRLVLESLRKICADDHMPDRRDVYRRRRKDTEFDAAFRRALEDHAHDVAEDIEEITDRMLLKPGDEKYVEPQAGRAAIQGKQFIAGRRNKDYLERTQHEITGKDGGPVESTVTVELSPATQRVLDRIVGRGE